LNENKKDVFWFYHIRLKIDNIFHELKYISKHRISHHRFEDRRQLPHTQDMASTVDNSFIMAI